MEKQLVCNMSLDTVNSRAYVMDDVMEVFIKEVKEPCFHNGNDFRNNLLITSVAVRNSDVDMMLRAASNAWEMAYRDNVKGGNLVILSTVDPDFDIGAEYEDLEDTNKLSKVSILGGVVTFVLKDMPEVEWQVIDND